MTNTLIFFLVAHIFLGTLGIIFLTAYLLSIFKKEADLKWLKINAFLTLLAFVGSWISGGYYYTSYYGKSVKPVILKGEFSWVHTILTETKEHIFLFLPFLAFTIFAITYFAHSDITKDKKLTLSVAALCFTTVSIALAIMLMGIVISGAVGK